MPDPAPFPDHFSEVAGEYAEFRPDYPPELFAFLASAAPGRRCAWDCATGSGQAAAGLAGHFARVVATDASARQIASARPHPRVEYSVAPAEASGLPDRSVELVTVAQAVHWFDGREFWAEVSRVLVPGGVVAVWCYHLFHLDEPVDGVIRRFYGDIVGPDWPPERKIVERGYRFLDFPFDEIAVPRFQMVKHWTFGQMVGYLRTWSAVRGYLRRVGEDPVAIVAADLATAWGDPERRRPLVWDLDLRVGKVRSRNA
ncbi:MAG TPA: class I SAM-dependent methyltransferase [Thermoanaerobaculia bacterium]|nr:class I SAM-dependent methyltransferase [Thermoanaerobaculia bacterium]